VATAAAQNFKRLPLGKPEEHETKYEGRYLITSTSKAATHSERRPAHTATRTPFNMVPCNRQLEVAMTFFADQAGDVAAFAKNAGPQALRVDYLTKEGRRAIYTPDFIVRTLGRRYFLVETKGQEDR